MAATTVFRAEMLGLVTTGHHIGLITSIANELTGSVTEVAPAGYARMPIAWGTVVGGEMANAALIEFPATTGSAQHRYIGLWSAATGGQLKYVWDLGTLRTYDATNQPKVLAGALKLDANRLAL